MALRQIPYDRQAAVAYARYWAYRRNPAFYNFDNIGGDCTNFASQCLYAGCGVMNYTPTFGWYYISADNRAPAWTGVPYFYQFLLRKEETAGPFAIETGLTGVEPGDFVQISFDGETFAHTPVITEVNQPPSPGNIQVAAHSNDADCRPLDTYAYKALRFLHILGARAPMNGGEVES